MKNSSRCFADSNSNIQRFFQTNDAYKGFKCPLVPANGGNGNENEGFVPDFSNRYFTEDIPLGLCVYKGLADIANVETPTIDKIITFCQLHMGKEYILNGKLEGKDVNTTSSPQRFGIKSISDLQKLYYP